MVQDASELVEQLQALLFSHTRVVEAGQARLKEQTGGGGERLAQVLASAGWNLEGEESSIGLTFDASVRMSLESFTRHCRGTVTSMTLARSCLCLVSITNLPYQAFKMMRPGKNIYTLLQVCVRAT